MSRSADRLAVRTEAIEERWSLSAAALGFLIGGITSLLALRGHTPLFGRGSIGEVAALVASAVSAVAFLTLLLAIRQRLLPWQATLPRLRRGLDLVGLTLLQWALTLLACVAGFEVFAQAFRELALDRWASAFIVAVVTAAAGYFGASSAASLTTSNLSAAIGGFLGLGALTSAISSSNPYWWRQHFSALGGESDPSAYTFNLTLILTGLVVITLADFLTHDLGAWAETHRVPARRLTLLRGAFIGLGVMLALVGAVPYNVNFTVHNTLAYAMVAVFAAIVVGVPVLFPTLSRDFVLVTVVVGALIAVAVVLHTLVGYLNTTAFEVVAVAIVFTWLVLLIRTITAAAADARATAAERGAA